MCETKFSLTQTSPYPFMTGTTPRRWQFPLDPILMCRTMHVIRSAIWTHCPKLHSPLFFFFSNKNSYPSIICVCNFKMNQALPRSPFYEEGIRLNSWHWNWACLLYLCDGLRTKCCSWMWLQSFYYTLGCF